MKKNLLLISLVLFTMACTTSKVPGDETPDHFTSNPYGEGVDLEIKMIRGEGHNHPLMAIWIEDMEGRFVQTLYVSESIGKGVFQHGDASQGFWMPGEIQRPAALPYWSHRRGIRNESGLYLPMYIGLTGFVAHVFSAGPTIMTGSMLGDITDLDELEHGKRREGVIFGAESLAYKVFVGLAPVIAGLLVDFAGIVPEMQPGEAPERTIMALGLGQGGTSFILFVISVIFVRQYDLGRDRHKRILQRLAQRRGAGVG